MTIPIRYFNSYLFYLLKYMISHRVQLGVFITVDGKEEGQIFFFFDTREKSLGIIIM